MAVMKVSAEEFRKLRASVVSRICSGCNSITAVKDIMRERGIQSVQLERELLTSTKGAGGKFRSGI